MFDKGNGITILNEQDYDQKILSILSDEKNLLPKNKRCLTSEEYQQIYPTAASTTTLYGKYANLIFLYGRF